MINLTCEKTESSFFSSHKSAHLSHPATARAFSIIAMAPRSPLLCPNILSTHTSGLLIFLVLLPTPLFFTKSHYSLKKGSRCPAVSFFLLGLITLLSVAAVHVDVCSMASDALADNPSIDFSHSLLASWQREPPLSFSSCILNIHHDVWKRRTDCLSILKGNSSSVGYGATYLNSATYVIG